MNDISNSFINQTVFVSDSAGPVNDNEIFSHELVEVAHAIPVFSTFEALNCSDLKVVIDSMNSKTCDLDPLPTPLLLKCITAILPPSVDIVNMSLHTGVVPSTLKHASITPLLKNQSADKDVMKNYRPVSNLSFTSKLIEKCEYFQVLSHLESNGLLGHSQSAYRAHHSCETALVKVHNDIRLMLDSKSNVVLILFDLSAAFDTVNHGLLIKKLELQFGLDGTVISRFDSYLSDREYCVKFGSAVSHIVKVSTGVPQGSILDPLLFGLYVREIENIASFHNVSVHMYADDIQCYFSFSKDVSTVCRK